jgi:DNA-binding CsgD family transcriptional regulator
LRRSQRRLAIGEVSAMSLQALYPFLPRLAACRTQSEVGGVAVDVARRAFGTHTCGAIFLDESGRSTERTLYGMRDKDFDEWDQQWRSIELVFPAMLARAAPVHNWQVYREDEFRSSLPYRELGKRLLLYHYMSAPIFGSRGTLVGALNFCRRPQDRPFDVHALGMASALTGFVSATLARVTESPMPEASGSTVLTYRELQVARLAAAGRNNLEIALQVGVARETVKQTLKRVYRKLGVSGRAQMASTMAARGWIEGNSPRSVELPVAATAGSNSVARSARELCEGAPHQSARRDAGTRT